MMTATICPSGEQLRLLSLGQLSEEQSDELIGHLRDCETCRLEIDTTQLVNDSFIESLKLSDSKGPLIDDEPECQVAVAKALGALALAVEHSKSKYCPELPTTIGEYSLIRQLGHGGMGTVFLAKQAKLGREVAIKVLASHRMADPQMCDRFEREMRSIGRLSHPNIVTAFDAREVDGIAVLITEFIDGLDLAQLISRVGPLQVPEACEIICRVADALGYTSSQGIVHRDIKPSNIMLSRNGEVKLLDLGLARFQIGDNDRSDRTATGHAMGTADYMSPEQVNDSRFVDVRSDIYSLGCTLFKLLTGRPPFADSQHSTAFAKMTAHVNSRAPFLCDYLPNATKELNQLVASMLAKVPGHRPQSPGEVIAILQSYAGNADMRTLIDRALAASQLVPLAPLQSVSNSPRSKPWIEKAMPISATIATGFFGAMLGFVLGVIVTIKHPDGTETVVNAPDGSEVNVKSGQIAANGELKKDPRDPQAVQKQIHGRWLVRRVINGKPNMEPATNPETIMTFDEKRFSIMDSNGRQQSGGVYQIDTNKNPFEINLVNDLKESRLGIFRFNSDHDDAFELILSHPPKGLRPQSFTEDAGVEHRFLLRENSSIPKKAGSSESDGSKSSSKTKLVQLGLAFHNFFAVFKGFPKSSNDQEGVFKVAAGKKIFPFSWRVAILPFISEEGQPHIDYHFDEPWDSEHNRQLLKKMPTCYRRPGDPQDSTETHYLGFSGKQSPLGQSEKLRGAIITDGFSNTVLLVETESYTVPWTKPEDIPFDEAEALMEKIIGKDKKLDVVMFDGRPEQLEDVDWAFLRKLVTHNDGEILMRK